jgi:hypothetical protein
MEGVPYGGITRLAPTPSGYLHAGNAINFLITARLAQESGSRVLLRIDDLDQERVRPEYVEDVFRSLEWLGIHWDDGPSGPEELYSTWSQQLRTARYLTLAATESSTLMRRTLPGDWTLEILQRCRFRSYGAASGRSAGRKCPVIPSFVSAMAGPRTSWLRWPMMRTTASPSSYAVRT